MLRRLAVYLIEMAPPWVVLPAGALHFVAIELGLQALAGREPLVVSWRSALGALGVVLFQLALRAQDELKDLETDRALAAAGDPKYAARALVIGRVLPSDLAFVRWSALALLVPVSALLGAWALAALAGVGALVWASFHWFFLPQMKQNLLLAVATHNPLAAAISAWCVAACVPEVGPPSPLAALLVIALWAPVAAWEVARKVRAPEDETAYSTYSKILGPTVAGVLPGAFVGLSAGAFAAVGAVAGLPQSFALGLSLAAGVPGVASLLFVLRPTRARARLQRPVELYALVAGGGFIAALALRHGVRS